MEQESIRRYDRIMEQIDTALVSTSHATVFLGSCIVMADMLSDKYSFLRDNFLDLNFTNQASTGIASMAIGVVTELGRNILVNAYYREEIGKELVQALGVHESSTSTTIPVPIDLWGKD